MTPNVHLSHPAPKALGMEQRGHRGVGCRCLLALFCLLSKNGLIRWLKNSGNFAVIQHQLLVINAHNSSVVGVRRRCVSLAVFGNRINQHPILNSPRSLLPNTPGPVGASGEKGRAYVTGVLSNFNRRPSGTATRIPRLEHPSARERFLNLIVSRLLVTCACGHQ